MKEEKMDEESKFHLRWNRHEGNMAQVRHALTHAGAPARPRASDERHEMINDAPVRGPAYVQRV